MPPEAKSRSTVLLAGPTSVKRGSEFDINCLYSYPFYPSPISLCKSVIFSPYLLQFYIIKKGKISSENTIQIVGKQNNQNSQKIQQPSGLSINQLAQMGQAKQFLYTNDQLLKMSSSKKELREARGRNYSFSSNQNQTIENIDRERLTREPLRETEIMRNYSSSRFQADQLMKTNPYHPQIDPVSPSLIAIHQEDEIRKLQQVIYYLTGDRDILKDECTSLQMELGAITVSFSKEKETFEAEIRKLKEIVKDKESQCQSLARALRKEKEIFEQEHERLNYQLKSTIQKKNDEIYTISRQKQIKSEQIKRNLESIIEEMKISHQKQLSDKDGIIPIINAQIQNWKGRFEALEKQLEESNKRHEEQQLRMREQHEILISDLKEGYHRTKMQIMEAAKQIVKALEENSQIQKATFLTEIDHLKQIISRYQKQNQYIQNIIFDANRSHDAQINGYLSLIKELQGKLQIVHSQKQKELQFLKIKNANIHSLDLQSAQQLFNIKITQLSNQLSIVQAENKRLKNIINDEQEKNARFLSELKQRDSKFYQELYGLRLKNSKALEDLKKQYEQEKSLLIQQVNKIRRESDSSSNKISLREEQLKKIRKLLDNKSKQCQQLQKQVHRIKEENSSERVKADNDARARQRQFNGQRQALKQQIAYKMKEIERLNNAIISAGDEQAKFDFSPLQRQIKGLRQNLKSKTEQSQIWKQKAEALKTTIDELTSQKQKLRMEIVKDAHESQSLRDQKIKQKVKDVERFYQRKIQFVLLEKQQIQADYDAQNHKIQQLSKKYAQLESAYQQLLSNLEKRTVLQEKIINLGLDINLLKNKKHLFEY